jgi:signal transduction histidine kinase
MSRTAENGQISPLTPQVDDAELRSAYTAVDFQTRLHYLRVSVVLAMVLFPLFSGLDWLAYPQHFLDLLWIRLLFDFSFLLIFAITFTPLVRFIRTIGVVAALVASASIAWMVMITEGAVSPYYAGLNLVLVVLSVLLPWTVSETTTVSVGTISLYSIACLAHFAQSELSHFPWSYYGNHLFFIVATSIICTLASYFQSRSRFEEFRLQHELDIRNRALTELDRLKSEFFANISHELRTPLTLILSPVQELLQPSHHLPDAVRSLLRIVESNAQRLLRLVNDLLQIIRLEEGKEHLQLTPLELNGFIAAITNSMTHFAQSKKLSLDMAIAPEPMYTHADPRALEKVIYNLLSNAIKFTNPGGRIVVTTSFSPAEAIITVTDTGIGISAENLPYVFDRFRQVDGSSTRVHQGTGLGLALVKDITERHGGQVSVHSEFGSGTTFCVRLPLLPTPPDPQSALPYDEPTTPHYPAIPEGGEGASRAPTLPEEPTNTDHHECAPRNDGRPVLLIVDDEPDMRSYLVRILDSDYDVLRARDGSDGWDRVRQFAPALVLLDVMLPRIDGLEVCRRIKADPDTRHVKVMLLTARVDETAKITALENGADDFLTKPFSSVEVRTRIRNLLRAAELERNVIERNAALERTLRQLKETQAQLIQSEKLNALGSLSAGLLHEINNPLNYTQTALQIAQRHPQVKDDDALDELLADMDEGMGRIKKIISDLRSFAYPSDVEKQSNFDIHDAVELALNFTAHELSDCQVHLELGRHSLVRGSKNHIVQVLVNLLTNSAKAIAPVTRERTGRIDINGVAKDGRLYVTIRDNGIGMGSDTLQRAFDPFFTTRDVGEGTGLGLSISHTIINNHGGQLTAASERGKWTEFTFDIELSIEADNDLRSSYGCAELA